MIKKELKFANLTFTMQYRHVFPVLRGVISEFYVLFPGSMLNHRPVCIWALKFNFCEVQRGNLIEEKVLGKFQFVDLLQRFVKVCAILQENP